MEDKKQHPAVDELLHAEAVPVHFGLNRAADGVDLDARASDGECISQRRTRDVDQAMKVIAGTARSMGVEVDA